MTRNLEQWLVDNEGEFFKTGSYVICGDSVFKDQFTFPRDIDYVLSLGQIPLEFTDDLNSREYSGCLDYPDGFLNIKVRRLSGPVERILDFIIVANQECLDAWVYATNMTKTMAESDERLGNKINENKDFRVGVFEAFKFAKKYQHEHN